VGRIMEKKKYEISEKPLNIEPHEKFCEKYEKNHIETQEFNRKEENFEYNNGRDTLVKYKYSIFNINNNTVLLVEGLYNGFSFNELTIAPDEKSINKTIEEIESKGFSLEEII